MELTARRLTDIYICLMLAAFPLWTGFEGYTGITRAKFLFFAALTGLWLAALALCALKYRARLRRPRGFALCVLAFMAAACLSAAFSGNFRHALLGGNRYDGLVTLLLYGCIALGVSRWGQRLGLYVNLIALAAGLCALVCFLQLLRVNVLGLFPEGLDFYDAGTRYSGEFLGTIGNTNLLAGWFCLVIPLLTLSALRAKGVRRWLLLLPAAGCLALRVAILALCIASFASVYLWPPDGGTLWELSEILHGRAQDGFGSSRVAIWREALRLFAERPLLGGGPDSFGLRSGLDFSRYVPETGQTLTTHADNAHCEPLGYLVNLGLLGFAAWAALTAAALRRWLRGAGPEYGAGLVCYLVQSLFGLGLCLVAPIAWIYMGLICSVSEEGETCRAEEGASLRPTS